MIKPCHIYIYHSLRKSYYYSNKLYQYKDTPGKAKTATANKFIKLAFSMMRKETIYYPRTMISSEKDYYQDVWDKVKEKLKPCFPDDVPQSNYLTKIQHELEENYGINTWKHTLSQTYAKDLLFMTRRDVRISLRDTKNPH